jgi:hypothetical protein
MNQTVPVCLLALMIVQAASIVGKPKAGRSSVDDKRVERAESRLDLAVQFDRVAQLKIASRKSTFHLGELITLDVAILNISSQPVFFHDILDLRTNARNPEGKPVRFQSYGVADRAIAPSSFTRVPKDEILLHSVQLLAGCDSRAFAQIRSTENDSLTIFKNDLFLNWGDACLPITQPGIYTFSVEVKNDYVLLAPRIGRIRTAVGKITSNPLEIKIIN